MVVIKAKDSVSNPIDTSSSQEANALASEAQTAPTDSAPKKLLRPPQYSPVMEPQEVPKSRSRSETRRNNKPVMEKRRRQRINTSLTEIADMLPKNALKNSRHAKQEKADILEKTVRYLKEMQKNMENGMDVKFLAGYRHCVREVQRFLDRNAVDSSFRHSLLAHLKNELKSSSTPPRPMTTLSPLSFFHEHVLPPRPMVSQSPDARIQAAPASLNDLRLMPTLLPSGEFALIVPASQARLFNNTMAVPCSPSPTCTISSSFSAPSTPPPLTPLYYNGLLQHAMTPPGLPPVNLNLSVQARSIGHFISPSQEEPLPLVKRAWQPWR